MSDPGDPAARLLPSWDANAAAWTAAVRSGAIESRRVATDAAILEAALAHRPQRTLDLGCGEGWLVRALAERGHAVVGIDGSAPLVAAAAGAPGTILQLSYAQLVVEPTRAGEHFDLVVANFALLEERVAPLLAALARIMAPHARLLIQTLHPLAAGPPYRDGWRTEDFCGFGAGSWAPMPWYFRTLASWLAVLKEGGFALEGLCEPVHPKDQRPLSLLLEARAGDA